MPPTLLPFWLIRVVWCPLAGPVVALCVPRPCVMKMFHAPVERSTVDPSYPVPRSKTAPVKNQKAVQKWCRNGAVLDPTALLPFWLIRVVWCLLAGPVVALCAPRPCVMKMFHAPVERSTVDPSCPVPRSKTAPVKIKNRCRNGTERSSFEPDRRNAFYRRQPRQLMRWRERFHQAEMAVEGRGEGGPFPTTMSRCALRLF